MVVVALQIAYLPTLYSAYNRRESLITVLSARGGEPAWGPEILARHVWLDLEGNLPDLYSSWESWAATVSESHTSYPVLIHFRSPQPLRSWLIALLGVMDAAALQTALAPTTAPVEARLLLQMGYLTLRDLAAIESIPTRRDVSPDDPIQLPYAEFERSGRHAELDRTEGRAHCRAGVAAFSGLAGQLRGRRLRAREAHRCGACTVVGSPAPPRAADPAGPTGQQAADNDESGSCRAISRPRAISGPRAGRRRSVSR